MTGKTEGARSRTRLPPSRFTLFSILLSEGTSNTIAGCEVIDVCWEQNVSVSFPAGSTHGDFRNSCSTGPARPAGEQRLQIPLFFSFVWFVSFADSTA